MSIDSPDYEDDQPEGRRDDFPDAERRAMDRTNVPGVFLIINGVLGILLALYCGGSTINGFLITPDQLEYQQKEINKALGINQEPPMSAQAQKTLGIVVNGLATVFYVISAVLSLLGGIRMRHLQSYSLSVTAAILNAVPCLSGCCLLFPVGIWALVVLLNNDVRSQFR